MSQPEEYISWSLNDPPYEDPEFDETSKAVASNSFLSQSLQVRAQSRLSNAKTHLHLIDEHIARADANLSELHICRRQCIAQIELYSTASAPVRRLPADVLVEIFRASLYSCDRSVYVPQNSNSMHHLLGRVCSGWRRLFFSTQEFWTGIRVGRVNLNKIDRWIHMAQDIFERSGSSPISLYLFIISNKLMGALIPHLGRIRFLSIHGWAIVERLLGSSFDLTSLTTLNIEGCGVRSINKNLELTALKNMPRLRDIRLSTYAQPALKILENYLGSQITALSLLYVNLIPQQVVTILHLSPNLISGSFNIIAGYHNPVPTWKFDHYTLPTPLVHNLQYLNLSYTVMESYAEYEALQLRQLVLPQLRHAVLRLQRWEVPGARAMITNSGVLELLHLQISEMAWNPLPPCLYQHSNQGMTQPERSLDRRRYFFPSESLESETVVI
ncbi:hypothetical protein H0H81_006373 [Sphagnurus paluster]|uniref:F-box domain-containing protein n=1 Tax=Sphagnurus paluster TaxID=117069 RepID=A0A9P7KKV3_9AGAR|nr:hypothetical protein H0H81_006373 [Sphagnurus paluster]